MGRDSGFVGNTSPGLVDLVLYSLGGHFFDRFVDGAVVQMKEGSFVIFGGLDYTEFRSLVTCPLSQGK